MFARTSTVLTIGLGLVMASTVSAQSLVSLRIEGPGTVVENSTAQYRVFALFDSELEFEATLFATLSTEPANFATISAFGELTTGEIGDEDAETVVHASFEYDGVTQDASLPVTMQYTETESGSALDFDGVDDVALIPAASSLAYPGQGGWTVEAWVYPREPQSSPRTPFVGQISIGLAGHDPYSLEVGNGEFAFRVENTFGTVQRVSAPAESTWTHVAGVYDPAGGTISLYVNGREVAWEPIAVLMVSNPAYPVVLGGQAGGSGEFNGRLDEVRIWRSARDYCDIRGHMDRRLSGTEPDLVGYWRLDRADQQLVDSSPFGNHAVRGSSGAAEPNDPRFVASGADLSAGEFPPIAWTARQLIPEVSSGQDWDCGISSDGLELFIASERDGFAQVDVYRATRPNRNSPFSAAVRVTELSVPGYEQHDFAPTLSFNGLRIYFGRGVGHGPGDLWVAERPAPGAAWSTPVPITSLNSGAYERQVALSADELHAVFATGRSGQNRYWTASRSTVADAWESLAPIASLSQLDALDCSLTADGLTLFMTAIGPNGLGGYDVWKAIRTSVTSPFGAPILMNTLSGTSNDYGISVSPDGREAYIVPNGSGGQGRVYVSRFSITGGPVDGELDCDGNWDLADFAEFVTCLSGPAVQDPGGCAATDYDSDGAVDLADLAWFQRIYDP